MVLQKLGIDETQIALAPQLTEILANAEGGIPAVMRAIRFSSHPEVEKFLDVWDQTTPMDREVVPLEAFALKADIDFVSFLGECIFALQNQFANIVKIIAVTSHPKVMQATIDNALKPRGYQDRKMIHQAMRFLPQNKGATNVFNFGPGGAAASGGVNPEDVETEEVFPDLSETQKLLTE
jgi:hypothetical protein